MANLLETEDPTILRSALLQAFQDIQMLEGALRVTTTLAISTAEDIQDYLDRPVPNLPPVLRKVQYMKEVAQRQRDKLTPR